MELGPLFGLVDGFRRPKAVDELAGDGEDMLDIFHRR